MFEQCMLDDDDVDVGRFMDTCRWYGDKVLTRMGNFTLVTVREIHANMDKVKHTYQLNPDKHRSMRALLEAEKASDMHQPGGILTDPSAAMGLLWARRGLLFWVCLFNYQMEEGSRPGTPTGEKSSSASQPASLAAYEKSLGQYNGWVSRNTFMLAMRAFPSWKEITATVAKSDEDAETDMRDWVAALEPLLERMDSILRELDLNDQRKSI